jgi:hypothetical protein
MSAETTAATQTTTTQSATTPPPAQTGATAPPPVAQITTTTAQTAPTQEAPKTVQVSPEEWAAIIKTREELARIQADQRAAEAKARDEQIKAATTKGEIENAFKMLRDDSERALQTERARLADVENRAKRYALDGELARALASQPLVPGGADQLTELWRGKLVVEPSGDSFKVQTPTFQPVNEFVASQLGRPEYAHFLRAQNPGGGTAGTTGAHQTAPTGPPNPTTEAPPASLGEAILRMAALKKAQEKPGQATGGTTWDGERVVRQGAAGFGLKGVQKTG